MASVIEVRRVIVYEGDAEWVMLVLAKSLLVVGKMFHAGKGGRIYLDREERRVLDMGEACQEVKVSEVPNGA